MVEKEVERKGLISDDKNYEDLFQELDTVLLHIKTSRLFSSLGLFKSQMKNCS